ncbi:hypothetical protein BDZ97DRAFT_1764959 [Flammula alnicola]|nr:hypothetical protein BDZ97DRAFT_1764959 [Flammula alnicola]
MSSMPPSSPSHWSSSPPMDFGDPVATAAAFATLKCRLATMHERLAEATQSQPKKTAYVLLSHLSYSSDIIFFSTVKTMGRGIRKVVSLFKGLSSIVDEADCRNIEGANVMESDPPSNGPYNLFLWLIPQLKKVIQDPDIGSLNTFLSDLQEGANGARGDDIKRVKEEVYDQINREYKPTEPLLRTKRDNRGLQHNVCGSLLTQIDFDWDNLEVHANIRATKEGFNISANYYLNCLYSKGGVDTYRVELNFLRSKSLLQVYCAIFTSPSSAEGFEEEEEEEGPSRKKHKSSKATKMNVSSLLNMDGKVTGHSIAYAAVLLVFNLTDATQWVDTHNGFSFIGFYNFIINYFEEFHNPASQCRVDDLLAWWNSQVFLQHVAATSDVPAPA